MTTTNSAVFAAIENVIEELTFDAISEERKETLQPLVDYIQDKKTKNQSIRLNFICTHNSRRSHLSQVWAQVMAAYFGVKGVYTYSGGTEGTALFPMVAQTLTGQGFKIEKLSEEANPIYSIKYAQDEHPVIGFSKAYDAPFNPQAGFAAIMTCSSADQGCPFIPGAEKRIPITFEDPKVFDNTPQQAEKYLERSVQIASELKYVFSQIK